MSTAASVPHNIELPVLAVPSVPVAINIDATTLSAILDNLVKNSVEAMPGGGSIQFDWTSDNEVAVLEVADNGPGLPEDIATSIAGKGTISSTKSGGNGLGLMSVRDVLRRVGGKLEHVPSSRGTVWHIHLPLANGQTTTEPQ